MIVSRGSGLNWKLKASLFFVSYLLLSFNISAENSNSGEIIRLPVRLEHSPSIGNVNAPVTIVEFTDFECPFCGRVQPVLAQIREKYPKEVRLVFKNFPLSFHRHARSAHLAALCAEDQGKFWEYRNVLFSNQKALKKDDFLRYAKDLGLALEPFETCLNQNTHAKKVDEDIQEAIHLGIQGTPSFLINGRPFPGVFPFPVFQEIIEEELKSQT